MIQTSLRHDPLTLKMAIMGYQLERDKIDSKIRELQALLKGKSSPVPVTETRKVRVKRTLSEEARTRIAAAQKKRWDAHRRKLEEAVVEVPAAE